MQVAGKNLLATEGDGGTWAFGSLFVEPRLVCEAARGIWLGEFKVGESTGASHHASLVEMMWTLMRPFDMRSQRETFGIPRFMSQELGVN